MHTSTYKMNLQHLKKKKRYYRIYFEIEIIYIYYIMFPLYLAVGIPKTCGMIIQPDTPETRESKYVFQFY